MMHSISHVGPLPAIPWLLTALRLFLAPVLWSTVMAGEQSLAIAMFLVACLTDVFDGRLARRMHTANRAGMYFDVAADSAVIIAVIHAGAQTGMYPLWCISVVAAMFVQFVVTSLAWKVLYDPLGRYYGGFLYILVGSSLIAPESAAAFGAVLASFTAACATSRLTALISARSPAVQERSGQLLSRFY